LAEFMPPIAMVIASIFKWILMILISKFALSIIDTFGITAVFSFFCIVSFLFGLFFILFAVETSGKSEK